MPLPLALARGGGPFALTHLSFCIHLLDVLQTSYMRLDPCYKCMVSYFFICTNILVQISVFTQFSCCHMLLSIFLTPLLSPYHVLTCMALSFPWTLVAPTFNLAPTYCPPSLHRPYLDSDRGHDVAVVPSRAAAVGLRKGSSMVDRDASFPMGSVRVLFPLRARTRRSFQIVVPHLAVMEEGRMAKGHMDQSPPLAQI